MHRLLPRNISDNAFDKHIEHGDASPGDAVDDKFGTFLGADCSETPPDASGEDLIWTSISGRTGIHTSFWAIGSATDDGSGEATVARGDGTGYTITTECVRIDGNEVNWGGYITESTEPTDVGLPAIGWAGDNDDPAADELGFNKTTGFPGYGNPCSDTALQWDGKGTVTSGEVIIAS